MTPKGLLRLKQAASTLADLAEGSFEPVLDDPRGRPRAVTTARALLGEGLLRHRRPRGLRARRQPVAVARLEQLYPFPVEPAAALIAAYPNSQRSSGRRRSRRTWAPGGRSATASRPPRPTASRSATSAGRGARARARAIRRRTCVEQDRIVREALGRCVGRSSRLRPGGGNRRARPWAVRSRAAFRTCWRCSGGSRRQMSNAVKREPHGLEGRKRGTGLSSHRHRLSCRCRRASSSP